MKIGEEIYRGQFGFMKRKGTANAILTIKEIKKKKKNRNVYLHFIDSGKAIDRKNTKP